MAVLTEQDLYRLAYNAHESAESAALEAIRAELAKHSSEALMCAWPIRSGAGKRGARRG